MEFFDKLTKKASETYKGAAEKTGKIAKEAKLKMKINDNKSKINELYKEMGKKVYQKHTANEDLCIKKDLEEECAKIDILSSEIDTYHKEILELSDVKVCIQCKEPMDKEAKFCPKCGAKQPIVEETAEVVEAEVVSYDSTEDNSQNETEQDELKENTQNEAEQDETKDNNTNVYE